MSVSCSLEEVFNLPACTSDATSDLKQALQDASQWLAARWRPASEWDQPYVYRQSYLPGLVNGSDVAALSRAVDGFRRQGLDVSAAVVLAPLVAPGRPVEAEDVRYLAGSAASAAAELRALLVSAQLLDASRRKKSHGVNVWALAGVGGAVLFLGLAVASAGR